jgi:hypothetical protein
MSIFVLHTFHNLYIPHQTQLQTISMIFTFDNKFGQTDEADYKCTCFIFQIKH